MIGLLTSLGLSKYVPLFEEAEIDLEALKLLCEDDLKELGLPIGPRLKLRKAIAELNAPAPAVDAAGPEVTKAAARHGERRQITVMFVDLVNFTGLASQFDPEEMGEIISQYQMIVTEIVSELGGHVAKYMGDGILCYFGWPRAHEDDAERAVRAGVSIIGKVLGLAIPGVQAASRVGIATGVVVVGNTAADGVTEMDDVVGETPVLAARLQALAAANKVVVAQSTRNLIGDIFAVHPLGARKIKGYAAAVDVYEVGTELSKVSRFEALHQGGADAMIGRSAEHAQILARWDEAGTGRGQFVLVTGEAGIGKSRIVSEVARHLADTKHVRVTCQCSPFHTESPLYPIVTALRRAADLEPGEDDSVRLDKIECIAGLATDDVPLIAKLLHTETGDRYPELMLSPNQFRTALFKALTRILMAQSDDTPFLFVFEDLHWIDPTSLELLDIMLDMIAERRILVLASARPSFAHGFGGHPVVSRLALNRLGRSQIAEMVDGISKNLTLPNSVLDVIAERTDGVPLFVQELTKAILESNASRMQDGQMVLEGDIDTTAIPATLNDSLMARLDRQINLKEAAQLAACIGREFEYSLLFAISPLEKEKLTTALDGLIESELIYRRGVPPDATFVFKHALVRDAAYDSLLRKRRRVLHARILSVLEARHEIAPEVLAHHAEAAGQDARAMELWDSASQLAISRPAFDEAISHLERALRIGEADIENADRPALERVLKLRVARGVALLARRGYSSFESQENFQTALALADRIGSTPLRFPILYGLWVGEYTRAEYHAALERALAIVDLAEKSGESAPRQVAWKLHGLTLCLLGRNVEAAPILERSLELFDPVAHDGLETRFGQDLAGSSHCYIMINSLLLGHTARAERHGNRALKRAEIAQHANTTCYVHSHLAFKALFLRDRDAFRKHAAKNADLAIEHNLGLWRQYVDLFDGIEAVSTHGEAGVKAFLAADKQYTGSRDRIFLSLIRLEAAWRSVEAGLVEQAAQLARMTRELIAEVDESFGIAELYRLEARLASDAGDFARADALLKEAIAEAKSKSHLLFRLRATIDLAALRQGGSKEAETCKELRGVLAEIDAEDCLPERATAEAVLQMVDS